MPTEANERAIFQPTRAAHFELVQMDGESILYDVVTHNVLQLDQPSTLVWSLCDGQRTVDDIVALLVGAYPAQARQIQDDVAHLIEKLRGLGALVAAS